MLSTSFLMFFEIFLRLTTLLKLFTIKAKRGDKMNKELFIKDWKKFLIDIGKNEKEIAEANSQKQQNLNRKIKEGTIKYLELAEIVEKYGYSVKIHKE